MWAARAEVLDGTQVDVVVLGAVEARRGAHRTATAYSRSTATRWAK